MLSFYKNVLIAELILLLFGSVGRKSSVLKMKPTPPVREVASRKRARSAPQTNALKRKVLMDDTMVLHGEYVLFCKFVAFYILSSLSTNR